MNGILFDSDILIELLRGKNHAVTSQFEILAGGVLPLFYSAVSAAEIGHGARDNEAASIQAFLRLLTCIPADCAIAATAGAVVKMFSRSHRLALGDALIAATTVRNDLAIWTRNRKHYPDQRLRFFEPLTRL